eukprot:3598203-Lingulodinium_polyedra.AAC.1
MYTDNWGVVRKVCQPRGLFVELAQPGMPQTSARAERCNQYVSGGLRPALVAAGLPDCFWSCVALCYAQLDNL